LEWDHHERLSLWTTTGVRVRRERGVAAAITEVLQFYNERSVGPELCWNISNNLSEILIQLNGSHHSASLRIVFHGRKPEHLPWLRIILKVKRDYW
jgi:hypothetical protein